MSIDISLHFHERMAAKVDVIIIGAGASGIACAIKLKQLIPESRVTVLEHLEEPCKKLYATGNGRCNITNTGAEGYAANKDFFESIGLILKPDSEGRMYPYSNQASGVVNVLLSACKKYGVNIITECNVYETERVSERFNIFSTKGVFTADFLVLATGGQAQQALGSDGSGYALARSFGHTVTPLSPALVQLVSSSKHCRALKGVRTKCLLGIEINGERKAEQYGELLFAEYGISGIVTMNLSQYVSDERLKSGQEKCIAVIDFVPDLSKEDLKNHLARFGSLEGILPAKLCAILSKQANGDEDKIVQYAKSWRLIITGTKGYGFAQITKGGVSLDELHFDRESRYCPNLYIIGELCDKQFECGGFNLDYAFSSGTKAAYAISMKKDLNNNDKD